MIRIIVAENEQRAREGICRLIESVSEDYKVIARASNGETALEMIREMRPDIVFTDIMMPYMDGIELVQAVREEGLDTEFVVISAYAEFQYAQKCMSLGVAEYLVKPVTRNEIEKVLDRLQARMGGQRLYPTQEEESLRRQNSDAHPLVQKALDMIETDYARKISQIELAERLGISPQYFSYIFSRHMGEGFSSFLKKYRIMQAEKLLCDPRQDRDEVAYQVGFSDARYFRRVFREVTGKSVSEYVREIRGVAG